MDELVPDESPLAMEHRCRMFDEMALALDREKSNAEIRELEVTDDSRSSTEHGSSPVMWVTSLSCPEFSLQVNDRRLRYGHHERPTAVARLSCAFKQEQALYKNGSWDLTTRIGSFVVKDLTSLGDHIGSSRLFPNLVGPKDANASIDDQFLEIDGVSFPQFIRTRISRSQLWKHSERQGSITSTEVRVLPLEIVYSTAPVEALSRILKTFNLEVVEDYHRVAERLFEWRERQKMRLLAAPSHKQKQIIVDVDVGAPSILILEENRAESPLLIIDLGKLLFSNEQHTVASANFDDRWRLVLKSIQVQCTSTHVYRDASSSSNLKDALRVVEPFSLTFAISTRIQSENDRLQDGLASIFIHATLPRLVFNMSA